MNKNLLRIKYKSLREELAREEVESRSLQIANAALSLPIWEKTYYHLFLTISEKKEVNTDYLLHVLQGRDKSVVIPVSDFNAGTMKHILLQENTILKKSAYGIPEPVSGVEIPPGVPDVIFIPLLAFDIKGNRIGYGKGFYDRFLSHCRPDAIFVGLSFFEPEEEIIPEAADIPLHYCITSSEVFVF